MMRIRAVVAAVLLMSVNSVCVAFPGDSSAAKIALPSRSVWDVAGDDVNTSIADCGAIFSSPLHWDESGWTDFAAVTLGTLAIMPTDSSGRRWVKENSAPEVRPGENNLPLLDGLTKVGNFYGNAFTGGAICAGLYIGGLAFKQEKLRVTGRMMFETLLFAGALTTVLKSVIGRSRPYADQGPYAIHGFQFVPEGVSLPSGHSTVAFAVSTVIAMRLNNPMAYILSYGLATLTAGARVYSDQHWLSDTFLGAAIGTCIGYSVVHLHDADSTGNGHALMLVPTLNGISLVGKF